MNNDFLKIINPPALRVQPQSTLSQAIPAPSSARDSAQISPARSPQSRSASPSLRAAFSASGSSPVHTAAQHAIAASDKFFEKMGRPDLARMAALLRKLNVGRWVYTGSVAMQIYGHVLGLQAAKDRKPEDIDIVVEDALFFKLERALASNTEHMSPPDAGTRALFKFENNVSVDVNGSSRLVNHGSDMLTIAGVHVASLEALLRTKRAVLGNAEKKFDGSEKSAIVDMDPELKKKTLSDIKILEELQKMPIPPELQRAYEARDKKSFFTPD